MKRTLQLLLALCFFTTTYGQRITEKQDRVKKFKETETIFVLSDVYDTDTYDKILKDAWTVTPYKVVKASDFSLGNYLDGKHSFAMLDIEKVLVPGSTKGNLVNPGYYKISYHISFFMFENEKKQKELAKFNKKSPAKQKEYDLFEEYRIHTGNILLYPKSEFSKELDVENENADILKNMYSQKAFYNYNLGFLKNYFQKMNSLIDNTVDKREYDSCTPELKNLKKQTLYIPSYVTRDCGENYSEEKTKGELGDFFNEYKYQYDIIGNEELDAKIISGEEFYYLRYFKWYNHKLLEIVNSRTGEIVYRCFHTRSNFITNQHFKDIKNSIDIGKV